MNTNQRIESIKYYNQQFGCFIHFRVLHSFPINLSLPKRNPLVTTFHLKSPIDQNI